MKVEKASPLRLLNFWIFVCLCISSCCSQSTAAAKPVPPKKHSAVVMAFFKSDPSRVVSLREFYDSERQRAAIYRQEPVDAESWIFIDFKTNKTYRLDNAGCGPVDFNNFLGTVLVSSQQVFQLSENMTYDPSAGWLTNAIRTNTWKGELINLPSSPNRYSNVSIKSSFAVTEWKFHHCFESENCPQGNRPVAFQVEFRTDDGILSSELYTFMDFVSDARDEDFTPPPGVMCPGFDLEPDKPRPFLARQFSLEKETIENNLKEGSRVTKSKIWYDGDFKVTRIDVEENTKDGYVTEVIDGENSIAYLIDTEGQCVIKRKVMESEESSPQSAININQIVFGVSDLSHFTYIGTRDCRLGRCEVWAVKEDDSLSFTEVYFIKEEGDVETNETYVPVQRVVTLEVEGGSILKPTPSTVDNIFDFETLTPIWKMFDVKSCYKQQDVLTFQVQFSGDYNNIPSLPEFERLFRSSIQDFTAIPHIRLTAILVHNIENSRVSVTVTLLEDPVNAGFVSSSNCNKVRPNNNVVYRKLEDAIFEGRFGVELTSGTGTKYVFKAETISKNVVSLEKTEEGGWSLNRYTKTPDKKVVVSKPPLREVSGVTLDKCSRLCDNEMSFECELFTFCRSRGTCSMRIERIDDFSDTDLIGSTDCNIFSRNYSFDYTMWNEVKLLKMPNDIALPVVAGAAEECLFQCSRNDHNKSSANVGLQSCNSMDFCLGENRREAFCIFHDRHLLEVSALQLVPDSNCIHFSRHHTSEFSLTMNTTVSNLDDYASVPQADFMSVEHCARRCATDVDGCTDFELCQANPGSQVKTKCILMRPKETSKDVKQMLTKNPQCDHYHYRLKKAAGQITGPTFTVPVAALKIQQEVSSEKPLAEATEKSAERHVRYSGASMAGLAVGMLILGGLIGAAVVYFVAKRQMTSGYESGFVMKLIGSSAL